MAIKKITENPKITDTIVFDILTPGADGCFTADPYKVDIVKIFFIQKNFTDSNENQLEKLTINEDLEQAAVIARKLACDSPTEENLAAAKAAEARVTEEATKKMLYYSQALPIKVFGSNDFPAWLSTDEENAILEKVEKDEDGNTLYGNFKLTWEPKGGIREGDYFICWTWTPFAAGSKISNNELFYLRSDLSENTVIPAHRTEEGKYELLLDRYLPEMYKQSLLTNDLTSSTLSKLNKATAESFTNVEDLANQIIDLYNANVVNESFLVFLSNTFGLKLRSGDPTLWRRQIKQAVPLLKKKGTLNGLKEALSQAGMKLKKYTSLWQIISPYTWQESFEVKNDVTTFDLFKVAVLPTNSNFSLSLMESGSTTFINLPIDDIEFKTNDGVTSITWVGDQKSVNPISLINGDILLVKYVYQEIPNSTQQTIEDFIQTLPLSDKRPVRDQEFPPKNWNVRLIEEDDPLFDILIPTRHPFAEPVVFGQIRTEFPYSENIYNMDEYNGSIRDSFDPCKIGKKFLDPCRACKSSSVSLDVGLEEISNDRISEAREIIEEYSPFHMVVHSLNVGGEVNEFVASPVEKIEMLVQYNGSETMIAGNANAFFHRVREDGDDLNVITRNMLASSIVKVSGPSGTIYNDKIVLFDHTVNFKDIGLDINDNLLIIKSPSPNSGNYSINSLGKNFVEIPSGVSEPLNKSSFTYDLMNKVYTNVTTSIYQDNIVKLIDLNVDFNSLGLQTKKEGSSWEILIPSLSSTKYPIEDLLSDGSLVLEDNTDTLPSSDISSIAYKLYTNSGTEVLSSSTGSIDVTERGRIEISDNVLTDIKTIVSIGDLIEISGTKYKVIGFVKDETHKLYIIDYSDGDASGLTIIVYRLLLNNHTGFLDYYGMKIETAIDHEFNLGILNGANGETNPDEIIESDHFKENFLILINGTDYYKIAQIDEKIITLSGPKKDYKTYSAGGTTVSYAIHQFLKEEIIVDENYPSQDPAAHNFLFIDRRGQDMVEAYREDPADTVSFIALANDSGTNINDTVGLEESVSVTIEYKNGDIEEGDLI